VFDSRRASSIGLICILDYINLCMFQFRYLCMLSELWRNRGTCGGVGLKNSLYYLLKVPTRGMEVHCNLYAFSESCLLKSCCILKLYDHVRVDNLS
jgi:hypothetical protein